MQQTPPNAVAIAEPNPEERTLALIGAMKDGFVNQFEYQGLRVRKSGESIEVTDLEERPLGGYLLLKSATLNGVLEWLKNKADLYEVKA